MYRYITGIYFMASLCLISGALKLCVQIKGEVCGTSYADSAATVMDSSVAVAVGKKQVSEQSSERARQQVPG